MSLILHNCHRADESAVRSVIAPPATSSYMPIGHGQLIDTVLENLDRRGLGVDRMNFALTGGKVNGITTEGARMFGEIIIKGDESKGYVKAIGIRNSIDKSITANICGGESVMVCGNMCFSGQFMVKRKHTSQIMHDLPYMIGDAIDAYQLGFKQREQQITGWQLTEIEERDVDHLLMSAFRNKAIPAQQIAKVLNEYENPHHPEFESRTAWSLHNAFTEVQKERNIDPNKMVDENIRLTATFEQVFPTAKDAEFATA